MKLREGFTHDSYSIRQAVFCRVVVDRFQFNRSAKLTLA
jgi:hypothetical protein